MLLPPELPPPDLQRELADLRAQVAEIRRAQDDRWTDAARAEQVRAIATDILADTSTRVQWAGGTATPPLWHSPYGGGKVIASADGNWTLLFAVTNVARFVYANASGPTTSSVDEQSRWGFENRRINFIFAGTVVDPSISYLLMPQYDSQPDRWSAAVGTLTPVYAWIAKDFGGGWSVMVGNQNVPWDLQTDYLEGCSLTAGDYSIFNYRFGVGRNPGVTLEKRTEAMRARGGVFSQLGAQESRWDAPTNLSFAVAGRAELKFGDVPWDALEVETSFPDTRPSVVIGAAGAMSNGRAQNPSTPPTPSVQGAMADVVARFGGFALEAQGVWMRDAPGAPALGWSTGAQFQASWFVLPKVETFVQGCWMNTSNVPWIAQAGVNYYVEGNRLKLTAKAFVPFGSGNVNGIGQLSGGLGMSAQANNASFVAQVQMMW